MAFRAKTFKGAFNEPDVDSNKKITRIEQEIGEDIPIGDVTFTGRFRLYEGEINETWRKEFGVDFGVPTKAQLEHPNLIIETLAAVPFPMSQYDAEGRGETRAKYELEMRRGEWPTEKERALQRNIAFRFKDRVGYTERMLAARGTPLDSKEGAERLSAARGGSTDTHSVPDLTASIGGAPSAFSAEDPPRRRGRPRLTDEQKAERAAQREATQAAPAEATA